MLGPSAKHDNWFGLEFFAMWPFVSKTAEAARDAAIVWGCAVLFIIIQHFTHSGGIPSILETTSGKIFTFALLLKTAFWAWRKRGLPSVRTMMTKGGGRHSHEIRDRTGISCAIFGMFAVFDTIYILSVMSNSSIGDFIGMFFGVELTAANILIRGLPASGNLLHCIWFWLVVFLAWRRM